MTGISWTLHTETESGSNTITASGLGGTTPIPEPGTEISTTLAFFPAGSVVGYGERYGLNYGGPEHIITYQALLPFMDAPKGAVDRRGTDIDEVPWFRENYGDNYPVESLLIGVEPGDETFDTRGWWGLLVDATDNSQPVSINGLRRVELTWFVLSRFEDYETHADVREAFADGVI